MKTAIVCYSFTHNNLILAGEIVSRTGGTLFNIEEKNSRTKFTIFLDMIFRRSPAIKDYLHLDDRFDHYILMSPVWGGKIASPLRSFLVKEGKEMKSYSFISICGGGDEQGRNLEIELATLTGKRPVVLTQLPLRKLSNGNVAEMANYRVHKEDLAMFNSDIESFIESVVQAESLV
jgi:hypothetical protein